MNFTAKNTILFANEGLVSPPHGIVSNIFRVGDKWAKLLNIGDLVNFALTSTPDSPFDQGLVLGTLVTTWEHAKVYARTNHQYYQEISDHESKLYDELKANYPDFNDSSLITVIHILPINP